MLVKARRLNISSTFGFAVKSSVEINEKELIQRQFVDFISKHTNACNYLEPGVVTRDNINVTVTKFALGRKFELSDFYNE